MQHFPRRAALGFALYAITSFLPRPAGLQATAVAQGFSLGPLVQVSGNSPFADCTDDAFFGPPLAVHKEAEAWIEVNPTNPNNIVGVWRQDQGWASARGLVAGVSFDGGATWQSVVIPGLTLCSGGTLHGTSDPYVTFASNGDLFVSSIEINAFGPPWPTDVAVSKSTDGGLTWSDPVIIQHDDSILVLNDKESITADPTKPNIVYATWDRLEVASGLLHRSFSLHRLFTAGAKFQGMFSRSTDGGLTWEPPRVIYNPGAQTRNIGYQILVTPNGTLVNFFTELLYPKNNDQGGKFNWRLSLIRSTDKGKTWSSGKPIRLADMIPLNVTDPETGLPILVFPLGDVAVDRTSGNLYAVWNDGRFSNYQYNSIAFSMSADGGSTWTPPIRINQTPDNLPAGNQQAFQPSIAVAADGTVGITYYDLRNNTPDPGLLTDYWFVHAHPSQGLSNPASWSDEYRLTTTPFDIEQAPAGFEPGYFVGDYQGMATAGNSFVSFFCATHGTDPGSYFFRRLDPLPP